MRLRDNSFDGTIGFQIAPMIDVVFVIMLFFMVMAGAVKVENELNIKLPGSAESDPGAFVDEVIINVDRDGQVTLNDEKMDSIYNSDMPMLKATLIRLKQASDSAKNPVVVTIVSDDEAQFGRTIDVLDSLSFAHISNVTFSTGDDGT